MQTVFDESLREAAGVGWGQLPALCQHDALSGSARPGLFQKQN